MFCIILFKNIETTVQDLIYEGFSCIQIVAQLHDMLIDRADINDSKKALIFEKIANIDNNLIEGADEYLQLIDLLFEKLDIRIRNGHKNNKKAVKQSNFLQTKNYIASNFSKSQ